MIYLTYGDSMITIEEEKKEKEFLKETSKKLEKTINDLRNEVSVSFSDLTDFKKLVWSDSNSFDSADQVQAKMLTNEEEVKILRKEDYLKKLLKIEKKPYFGSIIYKDMAITFFLYIIFMFLYACYRYIVGCNIIQYYLSLTDHIDTDHIDIGSM